MQNSLAGQTNDWRQFGSPGWHFGPSQHYRRWRTRRSASSSLRLPTAKAIFDPRIERVCAILDTEAKLRKAMCDRQNPVMMHGFEMEWVRLLYFRN
jgi:hypothetical protein